MVYTLEISQKLCIVFLSISIVLIVMIIVVPFLNDYGVLHNLDGKINKVDNHELFSELDPLSGSLYSIGDLMCHQMQSRTIVLNGNEMPICIRDFFLLVGFAVGMIVSFFRKIQNKYWILIIILGILLTPLEWCLEYVSSVDLVILRIVTSMITGSSFAFGVMYLFSWELQLMKKMKTHAE